MLDMHSIGLIHICNKITCVCDLSLSSSYYILLLASCYYVTVVISILLRDHFRRVRVAVIFGTVLR